MSGQPRSLKVMIVGAGTGGLCLAQGLKKDGVAAEVFERDHTPTDRLQGYRLSLSATGNRALKACLPNALFAKLVRCSARPSRGVSFQDHQLNRWLTLGRADESQDEVDRERPVSRIALRAILLEGLERTVHFGKQFVAFENAGA
jgi:2-polyprenyl-6-methoxyphenol hydroxylase-like FAD-dependent oxidoreductase